MYSIVYNINIVIKQIPSKNRGVREYIEKIKFLAK